MQWQRLSNEGSHAEAFAYPVPIRRSVAWAGETIIIEPRQGKAPRQPNRLLELHGLMGAIGEQFGLAWTAEQDVQRLNQTSQTRAEQHQRLVVRAQAELAAHFLLGSAHSLANLVLRLLLLNQEAAASLTVGIQAREGL